MTAAETAALASLLPFLVSLGLGLLIGLERERNPRAKAGLRTFALTALLGTCAAWAAEAYATPWLLVAGFASVALFIVAAYLGENAPEAEPGTTTEAALLVCYLLGAMVWAGSRELAVTLAILTTLLLYFKPEMKGIALSLTRRDLYSVLQFAVLSFVILPILPDRNLGPYQAFNPYQTWLMVVLISGLSLAGYVALRLAGTRHGALLLGFLGGMVSSTATTLLYARHARVAEKTLPLSATVIALANLVVLLRLLVLAIVVAPIASRFLAPVLVTGFLAGLAATLMLLRRQQEAELPLLETANPTELATALGFGLLYAAVLFVASFAAQHAGAQGLYAVAALSGLTDLDAITLSGLRLFGLNRVAGSEIAAMVAIAFCANLFAKLALSFLVGGRRLGFACFPPMLATGLGTVAGLLWL